LINSNDPDEPAVAVNLTGCVVAGTLTVRESAQTPNDNRIDFGTVYFGETARQTVTLVNTGDGPLTVISLAAAGGFSLYQSSGSAATRAR